MSKMRKSEPQHFFSTLFHPTILSNPHHPSVSAACVQRSAAAVLIILPRIQHSWRPRSNSRFHHVCPDTAWLGCRGRSRLGRRSLTLLATRIVTLHVEAANRAASLGAFGVQPWSWSRGTQNQDAHSFGEYPCASTRFPLGLLLQGACSLGSSLVPAWLHRTGLCDQTGDRICTQCSATWDRRPQHPGRARHGK